MPKKKLFQIQNTVTKKEWRKIPGFAPWYQVSNFGEVRILAHKGKKYWCKAKNVYPRLDSKRYAYVTIKNSHGESKIRAVHWLMLLAFVGTPKKNQQCRHLDGNPENNAWNKNPKKTNLIWGTAKENAEDKRRHGTLVQGVIHANSKLTEEKVREARKLHIRKKVKVDRLAKKFGVNLETMREALQGTTWKHVRGQKVSKNSNVKGSHNGGHKLTEKKVRSLKKTYATGRATMPELAKLFQVSTATISMILAGKTWKHVEGRVSAKRLYSPGSRNGSSKLKEADVKTLRKLWKQKKESAKDLAKIFGIGETSVRNIINKITWRHI